MPDVGVRRLIALATVCLLALPLGAAAQQDVPEPPPEAQAQSQSDGETAEDDAGGETETQERDWPGDPLVAQIQQGLMDLGYDLTVVDGLMGPNTRSAIKAFQKDQGMTVNGDATDAIKRAIQREKFQRTKEAERLWREARLYLRALGYQPGDGAFDSAQAQAALKRFANDHWLQLETTFNARLADVIKRAAGADQLAQQRLCGHHMDANRYQDAFDWCLRAARNDDRRAQYVVGWMHYYGKGVDRDYEAAFKWYREAALQGDPRAMTFLGLMYRKGLGVARNPDRAIAWYERAVETRKQRGKQ
ncbi:MAG: peptidoglycan-binding protein [Rhodovibrio sp.]|nr:peptidoglycan-binding protein [Rhodovibrio sp.]